MARAGSLSQSVRASERWGQHIFLFFRFEALDFIGLLLSLHLSALLPQAGEASSQTAWYRCDLVGISRCWILYKEDMLTHGRAPLWVPCLFGEGHTPMPHFLHNP